MKAKHEIFIQSIHDKKVLKVRVDSHEKGIIVRTCIPFDYGPSRKYKDGADRYHFYDLDSPDGKHNLSIKPEQLLDIEILNNHFDPSDYITWTPNWFIERDWGIYS